MPIFGTLIRRALAVGEKLNREEISPIEQQKRVLTRLLKTARKTAFGQYYGFKQILNAEDFLNVYSEKVPIFDYDRMHDLWWHMSLKGVKDISWPGKFKYYALSSGTSGAPSKKIPVTEEMMAAMRKAGLKMFFALNQFDIPSDLFTKPMLMLGGTSALKNQGGFFMGDLSGINASKPPFWLRPYYKPGKKIAKIPDWDERILQIAKEAPNWDIGYIVGIPAWLQLMMEKVIEYNGVAHIHEIWPNLAVCVHGGVHFEPYKKGFEQLMAKPLVYMDSYLASEGFIAYQSRPDTKSMKLITGNGIYYEFIPFTDDNFDDNGEVREDAKALNISQVKEGENYALLLTSCSGTWRYLIGDTIKFTDLERGEILITGRTKHYLSVCGEHLSVDNMNQAIQSVEEQLGLNVREFTVGATPHGRFFAHRWYIGADKKVDNKKLGEILDAKLKEVNDDYAVERGALLRDIEIFTIPNQLFYQWQEAKGKMGGQNKVPRVMKGKLFEEWENFVKSNHQTI
jgi:hypothetical protein